MNEEGQQVPQKQPSMSALDIEAAGREAQFCHQVLGQNIFTYKLDKALPRHPKTVKALRKLLERAGEVILSWTPVTLRVLAKHESLYLPPNLVDRFDNPAAMIILTSDIESESQAVVDYTVAHEFAHFLTEGEAQEMENADCTSCKKDEDGECADGEDGDECKCWTADDKDKCQACRDRDYAKPMIPNEIDYVLSPAERLADTQVLIWGYKLPAWKAKIREDAIEKGLIRP